MNGFDSTGTGIVLGLGGAVLYAIIRALRQKSFDVGVTALIFLAIFSLPSGAQLIRAGISGTRDHLPSDWRPYAAMAGIVMIGLAIHYLFQCFRTVSRRMVTPTADIPMKENAQNQSGESAT